MPINGGMFKGLTKGDRNFIPALNLGKKLTGEGGAFDNNNIQT